jgi:hypothetical protein
VKIRISIAYAASLSALSAFFALWNILAWLNIPYSPALCATAAISLIPVLYCKKIDCILSSAIFTLMTIFIILNAPSHMSIEGSPMNAFVLALISALIIASIKDSLQLLYSGLSFYIVGIFLLITFSGIEITISLAALADHAIGCIGSSCAPAGLDMSPSFLLFPMSIPATYPYFQKFRFRRDVYDKESP